MLWQEPEVEEDDDGSVTVRAFSADNRSAISFAVFPTHVFIVQTSLDTGISGRRERLERRHGTPQQS